MTTVTGSEILSTYIKKLCHPLKEIRERSLQLLLAKLQLGWILEDELNETRQLLNTLLAWFEVDQPSLQKEAFELLLNTIKTKSGSYIVKELGLRKVLISLNAIKQKIDPEARDVYNDVVETLRFLNTVESDDNMVVPRLNLNSPMSSEIEEGSNQSVQVYHNMTCETSKDISNSKEEGEINTNDVVRVSDGIKVVLFPWAELCSSDSKTILLIEDALKLLKSTRRCCRFIRDVFLRDFPPEIFLNRPTIIQNLLNILSGSVGGRPGEALLVLLYITICLCTRLAQLFSLELIHATNKLSDDDGKDLEDNVNIELEQIAGGVSVLSGRGREDGLAALKQLPAPVFALDSMHTVLTLMSRSVACFDDADDSESLDLRELNTCLNLIDYQVRLLLECVSESFWTMEHHTKIHRDVAHKSCMVMRLLGDLMSKYRKSFSEDTERCQQRVAWLRLARCAERLARWARDSAMPPNSLADVLRAAQLDPALELLYPELSERINLLLQTARISADQEHRSKYNALKELTAKMDDAVKFMKNKNNCRSSKEVLLCIKSSLPVLDLHLSESYVNDVSEIILSETKVMEFSDEDWSTARSIALSLMAHRIDWVQTKFYVMLADMVRSVLVGDDTDRTSDEKCLTLICDFGILTEICCHGLSSTAKEVEASASDIMVYLLRGRLVLSEGCWWRLLASLLPVLPLLHVYAAHDTHLGQAICKSLERHIAECMGVPGAEVTAGLVRLMFVRCVPAQMDAAHALCRLLDDERYLPPKESLRADVLLNALKRVEPSDFNVDLNSSPSRNTQSTGLVQILDVLKQDIVLDEHGLELVPRGGGAPPTLEPSLRRSALQQLAVLARQPPLHDAFLQADGLKVVLAILRMSLMVDDYLAFPECALSCVSVLNSVCFLSRHELVKIPDLLPLLIRVILVFPANESCVSLCAQVLALVAWAGFALQELAGGGDGAGGGAGAGAGAGAGGGGGRRRVAALPRAVTERACLPFCANAYWTTSPNATHSSLEWLLSSEDWRACVRVRWWCAWEGCVRVVRGAGSDAHYPPAPLALRPTPRDRAALQAACPVRACAAALLQLENATAHKQVAHALDVLQLYVQLAGAGGGCGGSLGALPWRRTQRYLRAAPASPRDVALMTHLLQVVLAYLDNVHDDGDDAFSWIESSFIGSDATVIELLSRDELYPEQTAQESIEVTQLHTHIARVLTRCIRLLETRDHFSSARLDSLVKILMSCLKRLDLKNFHMLGYLNELMLCMRYALNSRHAELPEETVVGCMRLMSAALGGCAGGGGRRGHACRLHALLALLALLRRAGAGAAALPVQRWSECWGSEEVRAVAACAGAERAELRAAAVHVMAALAHHAQMLPQLLQAIPHASLSQFAAELFSQRQEANVVRAAAAELLAAVAARASPHSDILESDVLEQLKANDFLENCLEILVDYCDQNEYVNIVESNVPLSVLEQRSQLEVRAEKCGDVRVAPSLAALRQRVPPTAALVAAAADALHNVAAFGQCPVQGWNERGLYRMLFRCASQPGAPREEATRAGARARGCATRALVSAARHKCVRATLAATHDCLHNLLATLQPMDLENAYPMTITIRAQALLLLAALLTEKCASEFVWRELKEKFAQPFFHLILQCLETDEIELQEAGLHCLTHLVQSIPHKKQPTYVVLLDSVESPYADDAGGDCRPEYAAEEMCKALMNLYQKLASDSKLYLMSQDERWSRLCCCLAALLGASRRARRYGAHRALPRALLAALRAVRDHLSVLGKPLVIRTADSNPSLRTLCWVLGVSDAAMLDCGAAKDSFAEEGVAASLVRLWPWCMMTERLRLAVVHFLYTFCNDCPKAWGAMCSCVGGRSLVGEVCALVCHEAALQSRARPDALLALALHALRRCLPHHHCRATILKSEALSSVYKLCLRSRQSGGAGAGAGAGVAAWAAACVAAARWAEGAAAVLALRPAPALAPAALRTRLLPALAHAAHHHRLAFLQTPELLELLSGTLLAGDTAEVVFAARAVWALAANHHKAKLQLRSAGVSASVASALLRYRRAAAGGGGDPAAQRALQLLTYTNTVLQAA